MKQESADKFLCRQSHHLKAVIVRVIPPVEQHLVVFQGEQPGVGNGHAVGIAAQVPKYLAGPANGAQHPGAVVTRFFLELGLIDNKMPLDLEVTAITSVAHQRLVATTQLNLTRWSLPKFSFLAHVLLQEALTQSVPAPKTPQQMTAFSLTPL
jgi:hypothetical protein